MAQVARSAGGERPVARVGRAVRGRRAGAAESGSATSAERGRAPQRADRRERPGDAASDEDAQEGHGHLQREPDEEGRRRQEPRDLARVDEPLHVLLAGEPRRGGERECPDRARADAALLDGEPDEADRREDGDDLRHVVEVRVHRACRRPGQTVGRGVRDEDSGRRERDDERPGEGATDHRPGMMPPTTGAAATGFNFAAPAVTFVTCAPRGCGSAWWPSGSCW